MKPKNKYFYDHALLCKHQAVVDTSGGGAAPNERVGRGEYCHTVVLWTNFPFALSFAPGQRETAPNK